MAQGMRQLLELLPGAMSGLNGPGKTMSAESSSPAAAAAAPCLGWAALWNCCSTNSDPTEDDEDEDVRQGVQLTLNDSFCPKRAKPP